MNDKITEQELLYDPMFAKKPVLDWTDSEKGGFFGKSKVKKTIFIIVLLLAIGGSLFFSFSSLSKDKYEYEPLDGGNYRLTAFSGQKTDTVLNIDYVRDADDKADTSKPVTEIKKFTSTGNDTLQFVYIGKDVSKIEETAFFYCTALNAVYVDDANENYMDIDGVLFKKENGVPVEAVFCPQQYTRYRFILSRDCTEPENAQQAKELSVKFADEEYVNSIDELVDDEKNTVGKSFVIPGTVTKIDQLCFAYCSKMTSITLPESLKVIESMAFFKCEKLLQIELPDGLTEIGSDAFSKCASLTSIYIPSGVKTIGHHAFWDCPNIETVEMAAKSLDGIDCGKHWVPQYRKTFMKDREIQFGAERGVK